MTEQEAAPAPVIKPPSRWKTQLKNLLIITVIVGLSVFLYLNRGLLHGFEQYGLFGIFLASFVMNSTLVLPLPTGILVSAMGAVFNPVLTGLAAGSGAALGELSGYILGASGREMVLSQSQGKKIKDNLLKYGDIMIVVLAFIPNPAFDLVGVVSGALKIPWYRFLFFCWIGKVLKFFAFALTGSFFT